MPDVPASPEGQEFMANNPNLQNLISALSDGRRDAALERIHGERPYHLRRIKYRRGVRQATNRLFRSRPWAADTDLQDKYERWLDRCSAIYDIATPELVVDPEVPSYGYYTPGSNTISLPVYSVVSMMHEFRHAVQAQNGTSIYGMDHDGLEEDAISWSLRLFYLVRPEIFERAVRSGRILYVSPDQL